MKSRGRCETRLKRDLQTVVEGEDQQGADEAERERGEAALEIRLPAHPCDGEKHAFGYELYDEHGEHQRILETALAERFRRQPRQAREPLEQASLARAELIVAQRPEAGHGAARRRAQDRPGRQAG